LVAGDWLAGEGETVTLEDPDREVPLLRFAGADKVAEMFEYYAGWCDKRLLDCLAAGGIPWVEGADRVLRVAPAQTAGVLLEFSA